MTESEVRALRDLVLQMLKDRDEATRVAMASLNNRLDEMNEFRLSLKDQSNQFITRNEHEVLQRSISRVEQAQANLQGRYAVGALLFTVIMFLMEGLLRWAQSKG